MHTIKVLVVDDSRMVRKILTQCLNDTPDIQVIGEAADPFEAREKIKELSPDVLTLDIDMPGMDGLSFLEKLMRLHPMPVVMVSKMTQEGAMPTIYALALGAVEAIGKPTATLDYGLDEFGRELADKIRVAAHAKVRHRLAGTTKPKLAHSQKSSALEVIAMGASTGGVETLCSIFASLVTNTAPIVITQHMPPTFTRSFANRLDSMGDIRVSEAADGDRLLPGHAYVAPGDRHLLVRRDGKNLIATLDDGPKMSGHKPSVDCLFRSVAETVGRASLGVILTGMGRDGASGLLAMREKGATTIGQDESSCVVYGMPRAAAAIQATSHVLPLEEIVSSLNSYA